MSLTKVKAGNILLTTPSASSNDVTPATTQYVTTALANMVDSAPSTLNTLNELAAALGDDANFSTTVTNSIAAKLPLAGGTLTGTLTTPTLITGAYGGSGSAGDGFRLNSTDLYGQIDASDKIRLNVNGDSFLNGGNLGIGVVPTANWHANATALQISPIGAIWNTSNYEDFNIGNNVYTDGTEKYIQNDAACKIRLTDAGLMDFRVAGAGTAGNAISFTTALSIEATGNTMVGKGFAVRGTQVPSYGKGIEMHQSGDDMHIYAYDRDNSAVKDLILQNPGGNIGVGTTSPGFLGLSGSGRVIHLNGTNTQLRLANSIIHHDNAGLTKLTIRNNYGATSNSAQMELQAGFITFETGTSFSESMRIDSSGRVGIRNDGPGDFHAQADDLVIGNSSGHSGMTIRSSTTDAGNIFFADGTSGSQAYMGSIQYFHGADSSNNLSERMSFGCNGGSEVLRLSRTTNIGYTSDGLFNSLARPSRWQATGTGALLLGYRDSGSGLYSAALGLEYDTVNGLSQIQYVDGFLMRESNTGTLHFRVETNGNVKNTNNSYGSTSDSRLKTDIADAASQWDDVKALRVRKYKFGTAPAGHDFLQIGVIAQELEASGMSGLVSESEPDDGQIAYAPELVGGQVKTVKYSVLYMKAIKALQEAMTRIETLESKVATLEGE